jgi:hypothetical protein
MRWTVLLLAGAICPGDGLARSPAGGAVRFVPTAAPAPMPAVAPPIYFKPSFGAEAVAKSRIEADGYGRVIGLIQGPDGAWRGKALRGDMEVLVKVDAKGIVTLY